MFKKRREKRKGIWICDIGPDIHMDIKLLSIAEGKHMYQLAKELLAEALEARRLRYESSDKSEEKESD